VSKFLAKDLLRLIDWLLGFVLDASGKYKMHTIHHAPLTLNNAIALHLNWSILFRNVLMIISKSFHVHAYPTHAKITGQQLSALAGSELSACETVEQQFRLLKRSYFGLIRHVHPDKGGDAPTFRRVQAAFQVSKR
jgi:hypothetical protein